MQVYVMREKLERFYVTCQFDMFTQILWTFKAIHCQGNVYLEDEDGGAGKWRWRREKTKKHSWSFSTINITNFV